MEDKSKFKKNEDAIKNKTRSENTQIVDNRTVQQQSIQKFPKNIPVQASFPKTLTSAKLASLDLDPNYSVFAKKKTPKISFTPNFLQAEQRKVNSSQIQVFSIERNKKPNMTRKNPSMLGRPPGVTIKFPSQPKPSIRNIGTPREFQEAEIAPTAKSMGINPLNPNHPLTLPFMDSQKLQLLSSSKSSNCGENENNDEKTLDPAKAGGLFKNENQIFFIQLPSHIPLQSCVENDSNNKNNKEESDEKDDKYNAGLNEILGFKSNLSSISGKIGKFVIYKSGKVKLNINDILFDVFTGMPCNFLQEVVAISSEEKKYYQLGEITKRMVCSPDLKTLI